MGQCPATFLSMDSCAPRSAYDKLSMWRRGHILGKRQCPCSMCSPNRRNDASVVAQTADVQSFARWEWCADGVGGGGRVEDQERETGVCVGGEGVVSSGGGVCERVCVRARAHVCVCGGGQQLRLGTGKLANFSPGRRRRPNQQITRNVGKGQHLVARCYSPSDSQPTFPRQYGKHPAGSCHRGSPRGCTYCTYKTRRPYCPSSRRPRPCHQTQTCT